MTQDLDESPAATPTSCSRVMNLSTRLYAVILAAAALLFGGCALLSLPWWVTAAPAVAGVLASLVATIRLIREHFDFDLLTAGAIAVVSFAGGNLPFILLVPATLALGTLG